MKRVSLVVLSVLMAFAMMFATVGCGNSDEQVIKKGLTEELNQFKDPNSDVWQKDFKSALSEFEGYGINSQDLVSAWTDGFKFEIGTITVDGDKATAEVTITCKQFYPAVTAATNALTSDPSISNLSMDEMMVKYTERVITELKQSSPASTTISISCTKVGNTWSVGLSSGSEVASALLGSM